MPYKPNNSPAIHNASFHGREMGKGEDTELHYNFSRPNNGSNKYSSLATARLEMLKALKNASLGGTRAEVIDSYMANQYPQYVALRDRLGHIPTDEELNPELSKMRNGLGEIYDQVSRLTAQGRITGHDEH